MGGAGGSEQFRVGWQDCGLLLQLVSLYALSSFPMWLGQHHGLGLTMVVSKGLMAPVFFPPRFHP